MKYVPHLKGEMVRAHLMRRTGSMIDGLPGYYAEDGVHEDPLMIEGDTGYVVGEFSCVERSRSGLVFGVRPTDRRAPAVKTFFKGIGFDPEWVEVYVVGFESVHISGPAYSLCQQLHLAIDHLHGQWLQAQKLTAIKERDRYA